MTCDAGWQFGFVAGDHDPVIFDADCGNYGSETGLPGVHVSCFELLPREATHGCNYLSNTSGRRADEPVLFLFKRQSCRRWQ